MNRVIRKTTGMNSPRMTARKAPNDTSRPIVPPSTATTPASVWPTCSTLESSSDIFGAANLDMASLLLEAPSMGWGTKADATAARHARMKSLAAIL